jgi:hypothetical protein
MNRNAPEYRAWVYNVKERAGFKCKMCNNTKNLHSHHVMPCRTFPQFALDPSNGICLCDHCHNLIHGNKFKWKKKL